MTKYFLLLLVPFLGLAQKQTFDQRLFDSYENFRETSIDKRRFKHRDIQPLIDSLKSEKGFEINVLGKSRQGRTGASVGSL